jgi:hypothetical protein
MKITVTQEHIDKGIREDCTACPIALALRERGFDKYSVGRYAIYPNWGRRGAVGLSRAAVRFTREFDQGLPVQPFSFNLPGLKLKRSDECY